MMRIRLTFSKNAHMRFTGHMDLHRTLERTLRRSRLPLATSQGYTKRTRLNIATALPLGVTGENEIADFWLEEPLPLETVREKFEGAAPPGIRLQGLEAIDENAPKLQKRVRSSIFEVTLLEALPDLESRVKGLLAAESLPRTRRDKPYDLRPLVVDMAVLPADEEGYQRLEMHLLSQDSATGRADEVVAELGGNPHDARYHRKKIILSS